MTTKLILILLLISTSICAKIDCEKYPYKYVPIDLDDALNYLDCKWSESEKDCFKNKPEKDIVTELHWSTGLWIRNSWGISKGNSRIVKYFRHLGINNPDDMSGIILTSFHRYLNKLDIKLDEQIKQYKDFSEKIKQGEIERMNEFDINDTVDFRYPFGFVSKDQEHKVIVDSCIAKGLVIAKDTVDLRLQIRLLENCDEKGIIISKEWKLKGKDKIKDKIKIMKMGETKWTDYLFWETIE
jgi:hypothetical protein